MNDPPRILIVDDSEVNRDILDARLKSHGFETLQAADGEEALDAARRHLPDLILLDVMMPKLNGFEVCRRLKSDTALPFMSIILVTSRADTKDIVLGLDAGADEYLTKPVDQAALMARVRSTLRLKALHDRVLAQAADLASWNQTLKQRGGRTSWRNRAHRALEALSPAPDRHRPDVARSLASSARINCR